MFIVGVVFSAIGLFVAYRLGQENGSRLLTSLKTGEYKVEALINNSWGKPSKIVVSWHVAEGHWEYRILDVRKCALTGPDPAVGDSIVVRPNEPGVCLVAKPYVAKNS